ncbi:helix-turn-helix domain-containing protein [Paenibacillus puldeungensis]|uniref:Helix-turn-helix domain-containing protein n=1 Tax=Paenibacillus puldeungensis TaxID=696536 RepID=A0ABW3S643_9BACL
MEQAIATVGRRKTLREWRAFCRLNKKEVASLLGVHISTYAKMEDDPVKIQIKYVPKLAEVFGCDTRDIIFFENDPNTMLDGII